MDHLLKKFETRVNRSVDDCGKLLGYARSSYYQVRNADNLPPQTRRLVEVMLDVSDREFRRLVTKHLDDDDDEL